MKNKNKNIFLITFSFLITILFFNHSFANTWDIIQSNSWVFFLDETKNNWVYYWKKKLEEQKLDSIIWSSWSPTSATIKNNFYNYQNTFLGNYNNKYTYPYLYYEIDLNNDIEVTKIEYYLWNEMNFKWVSTWNWTSKIYLYFDSFYDKKIDNYGNIEYIWKYENFKTYAFSPEKLKIFQSSDIIEINFQFYLPKFDIENFYNGFIVRNLSNKIVINTTSSWDLNNNFKLNYDYVFDNKLIPK